MLSCLSGLVRVGVTTLTACYMLSCLSGWGGVTTQTACYVPSCLSGLVRVGGYNTDRVLCAVLSVCRGVTTGQHITRSVLQTPHPQTGQHITWSICGGGLQHRLCYVPSCLSGLVRVGWGVTTQTACSVLSVGVG